jgi:hypothetical protein
VCNHVGGYAAEMRGVGSDAEAAYSEGELPELEIEKMPHINDTDLNVQRRNRQAFQSDSDREF